MTIAEASVRLQMALERKKAARARCQTLYFDEPAELGTDRGGDFNALRAAEEEFERCKKEIFAAARAM